MRYEDVESAALQLSRADRARIAARLIASLDEEEDGVEEAWTAEVEQRVSEVDAGKMELIPGKQVMREVRALIR